MTELFTGIDNKENLDKVLTKKFYISDDELNDYIPNVESLINEDIDIDIEELNKYIFYLRHE